MVPPVETIPGLDSDYSLQNRPVDRFPDRACQHPGKRAESQRSNPLLRSWFRAGFGVLPLIS